MDSLRNKKVLVTGADGFIGSHLTQRLVELGCNVRAFVMYNSFGHCGWIDSLDNEVKNKLDIFSGDIRDANGVRVATKDCQVIFHLASLIGIPYSYHSPSNYVDTNIKGTLNILQAAKDFHVERVIHTSTSEVYGTAQFVPITEEHPNQGQSPYSATKIAADQMALSFYRSFGTPVSILRPFNTYGPRQSARAVIPTVISQIAQGAPSLQLGSLTPTRDFSFVLDTVRAFLHIASSDKTIGEVVNCGSGFEISIGDTVDLICQMMGKKIDIISDEKRKRPKNSEVYRLFAGIEKAQKLMNWQPEYGGKEGFERGLRSTIDWFSAQDTLQNYQGNRYYI